MRDVQAVYGIHGPLLVFVGASVKDFLIESRVFAFGDVKGNADHVITRGPLVLLGVLDADDICVLGKLLEG